MKAVVCVKQTPSTTATFTVSGDSEVSWEDAGSGKPNVVNPWDEYTVEEGIRLKENHGATDVVALTFGAESSIDVLRTSLAMGCTSAVQVTDSALDGLGNLDSAKVLAAAIDKIGDVNIVICGKQAIDGDSGVTPVMLAKTLGWTPLTFVSAIKEVSDDSITVERTIESGKQEVSTSMPVVISVVNEINEPRYPSFMGIRKANKAQVPVWTAGDLDVDVSADNTKVSWSKVYAPPAREGEVEMIEGDDAAELAEALVDKLLEEKVL